MRKGRAAARTKIALSAALVLLVFSSAAAPRVSASTQKATEERLTCQCGCGLTVHTCNHLQCSFAVPVREDIAESLAAGQSTQEIISRYVDEYGEKVLSSPTTKGFNLLAWWGPYIALFLGTLALLIAIRRWRIRAEVESATATPSSSTMSAGDRDRIARELEDLDS